MSRVLWKDSLTESNANIDLWGLRSKAPGLLGPQTFQQQGFLDLLPEQSCRGKGGWGLQRHHVPASESLWLNFKIWGKGSIWSKLVVSSPNS